MSQYKPYAEYKESGVEWLPMVPSHWAQTKLKYVCTFSGGGTPSKENEEFWNGNIPWLSPKDMKFPRLTESMDRITPEAVAASSTQMVPAETPLIVTRSGILQHTIPIGITAIPMAINQDLKAFHFDASSGLTNYFFRWVQGLNSTLLRLWRKEGPTVESLEHDYVANSDFLLPSLPEQHAIATFLDRETAKIDALIEKKSKFIELLEEKRQTLISHAVTKGLNPDAPMKDSGVPWLGEVPAHWEVLRFQRIVKIRSGQVRMSDSSFLDQILIAPNHIESRTGRIIGLETAREQNAISGKYQAEQGDVIYSKIRPALRKACLAPERSLCSADMYALSSEPKMQNEFLLYFLLSEPFSAFSVLESERVAMPKINRDSLNSIHLAVPPYAEQSHLIEEIRDTLILSDNIKDGVLKSITLLREKRSALITAAVTGQIDVRDEVAS